MQFSMAAFTGAGFQPAPIWQRRRYLFYNNTFTQINMWLWSCHWSSWRHWAGSIIEITAQRIWKYDNINTQPTMHSVVAWLSCSLWYWRLLSLFFICIFKLSSQVSVLSLPRQQIYFCVYAVTYNNGLHTFNFL